MRKSTVIEYSAVINQCVSKSAVIAILQSAHSELNLEKFAQLHDYAKLRVKQLETKGA